jgi:predicted nucleic acid binding AN1-type Zn finger protein
MVTKKKAEVPILLDEDVPPEKEYVLITTKVDAFTTHTKYVELKPDQCNVCGFSVCEVNKLPAYEYLDSDQKLRVDGTLESHMRKHPGQKPMTLRESELPGTQLTKARAVK